MRNGAEAGREALARQITDRIRGLIPGFARRAEAAEKARRLPDESIRELIEVGVARILVPPRFGGYGLGLDTWFEVVREISKADASHGWCAALMTHHPHYVAQCSEEAQAAVWANGADVVVAASVHPVTRVTREAGGYRVTGASPFASGVAHSTWAFVGGMVDSADGPEWTLFLIPPDAYTVEDTWFTTGMCATGSNTIVTDDVFVPESRAVRVSDLREGTGPGGALHDRAIYRAPLISYAPATFATPMLGAAQGAYEMFRNWTRTRQASSGGAVAESVNVQIRLARAAANLDAAELLLRRTMQVAQAEVPPSLELRARSMRDFSRAGELTTEAIDTLLSMCGTAGFALSHPVQRAWRDIHFASMHASLTAERNFAHFGRMELGQPRDPRQPFF
jgi:3-hydroxy-9,10-secoandrosta-1,3,5(10)-triene-9,17-dione monooxygenase